MALSIRTKIGYGMGHILNDLCSAVWFSYLLVYFHHVLNFPNALAGVIVLIGQVADAMSTPFVGHEADRTDDLAFCLKYGRRKTWHLIGTICVTSTFAFIFIGIDSTSYYAQMIYLSPIIIIFQFGWASTQISHLALLPNLTSDPHERTELNAIRYACTVLSTITVYCITWLILGLNGNSNKKLLGASDQQEFIKLALIILVIGVIFSIGFHILIKEDNSSSSTNSLISQSNRSVMEWRDWFREPQMYIIALMYMSTRLFCNLIQAYIPLYLEDTLELNEASIAYIPLVMYISGFIATFFMKRLNRWAGRKITYILGCCLGLAGSIWVYFGDSLFFTKYYLYVVAFLLGGGSSTMLVTSLSMTADFIGNNVECGAFVYGIMSFTDKLSNGLAFMLIQSFTPTVSDPNQGLSYFRYIITYVCGGTTILGIISILILSRYEIGKRKYTKGVVNVENEAAIYVSSADSNLHSNGYAHLVDDEEEDDDDEDVLVVSSNSVRT